MEETVGVVPAVVVDDEVLVEVMILDVEEACEHAQNLVVSQTARYYIHRNKTAKHSYLCN